MPVNRLLTGSSHWTCQPPNRLLPYTTLPARLPAIKPTPATRDKQKGVVAHFNKSTGVDGLNGLHKSRVGSSQLSVPLPLPFLVLGDHVLTTREVGQRLVSVVLLVPALPLDLVLRLGFAASQIFLALADDLLRLVDVLARRWVEGARRRALVAAPALCWQWL